MYNQIQYSFQCFGEREKKTRTIIIHNTLKAYFNNNIIIIKTKSSIYISFLFFSSELIIISYYQIKKPASGCFHTEELQLRLTMFHTHTADPNRTRRQRANDNAVSLSRSCASPERAALCT
ncbi:unnamed protein product [Gadus morhua 'NCC']